MKIIFITIILFCSCHSYSFRKGEKDETDSIRLQKELGALHRYVEGNISRGWGTESPVMPLS